MMISHLLLFALISTQEASAIERIKKQDIEELLDVAGSSSQKLSASQRLAFLEELVGIATEAQSKHLSKWITELDTAAKEETDDCVRSAALAKSIQAVTSLDISAAQARLLSEDRTCAQALIPAVNSLIAQMRTARGNSSVNQIRAIASAFGEAGEYPYSAMRGVVQTDRIMAEQIVGEAILSWKEARRLTWNSAESYVDFLSSMNNVVSSELTKEGVYAFLNRIDKISNEGQLQTTALDNGGGIVSYTQRDYVLSKLEDLANSIGAKQKEFATQAGVFRRVDAKALQSAVQFKAGTSSNSAKLRLDVDRVQVSSKTNLTDASLNSEGLSLELQAALLAKAAQSSSRSEAEVLLSRALAKLKQINNAQDKLDLLVYVERAAIKAGIKQIATDSLAIAQALCSEALRDEDEKRIPIQQSKALGAMRRMARVNQDSIEIIRNAITNMDDQRIQAAMALALADSLLDE